MRSLIYRPPVSIKWHPKIEWVPFFCRLSGSRSVTGETHLTHAPPHMTPTGLVTGEVCRVHGVRRAGAAVA